jgi:hypothetical protein
VRLLPSVCPPRALRATELACGLPTVAASWAT